MPGLDVKVAGAVSAMLRDDGTPVLDGMDLRVGAGVAHALVGESASGKTTLARAILGRVPLRSGSIRVGTFAVPPAEGDRLAFAAAVGFVAQDAAGSLDPSMPAWRSVTEGARIQGRVRRRSARDLAAELFRRVDLSPDLLDRLPGELSGGQCQRVAIARAVALGPGLIVADEPTSALDPIVQAGVMALLDEVRAACGATLLLVSHSLALARRHAEEVSVVHRGRVVETGAADRVLRDPAHERTRALLAAEPAF